MIEPKMVLVEGGSFMMGSEEGFEDEKTIHEVTLSSFYIGQFAVTQKEWEAIMGSNPSDIKGDDRPVTNVSWEDVQEFIQKLNKRTSKQYRLPTEAEWEFAARGGNQSKGFKYAGSDDVEQVAWFSVNSKSLQPVGQKKANELGLYDMSGNIFEWCLDWYEDYPTSVQVDPKGPDTGSCRATRGGSWTLGPWVSRVSFRDSYCPEGSNNWDLGFRLAHDFKD